jgi:TP901 family phage tail tape measure protein
MGMSAWRVFVTIRATNLGGAAFMQLGSQANAAEAKIARIRTSMLALRATVGAVMTYVGAAFIAHGVDAAAQLERAMTAVGVATGTTGKSLSALRSQVMQVSGVTAQSAITIAQEMATAASAGLNNPQRLAAAFSQIAKFADIQYMGPHAMDPVEAVRIGTQFAHLFRTYQGAPLQRMLDDVNRIMFVMPERIQNLLTQGRYFISDALAVGVSEPDIMQQLAIMGQTGFLRGKGGTGLDAVLRGSMASMNLTGFQRGKQVEGLRDLGILDFNNRFQFADAQGHLLLNQLINQVVAQLDYFKYQDARTGQSRWYSDLVKAYGIQGARYLTNVATPAVQAQEARNRVAFGRIGTIEQIYEKYYSTFFMQWRRFVTNIKNITMDIFMPILPRLTPLFRSLAYTLGDIDKFLLAHPKAGMAVAISAFAATGASAAFAAVNMWKLVAAIDGLGMLGLGSKNPAMRGVGASGGMLEGLGLGWLATLGSRIGSSVASALRFVGGGAGVVGRAAGPLAILYTAHQILYNLPDFLVMVRNWWARSSPQIAGAIGSAFAEITFNLQQGITSMYRSIAYMFTSGAIAKYSALEMLGRGDMARLFLTQTYMDAVKRQGGWTKDDPGSFGHYLSKKYMETYTRLYSAGRPAAGSVTLHIGTIGGVTIQSASGNPRDHAKLFIDEVVRRANFALRSAAGGMNSPRLSTASVGNGVFGGN